MGTVCTYQAGEGGADLELLEEADYHTQGGGPREAHLMTLLSQKGGVDPDPPHLVVDDDRGVDGGPHQTAGCCVEV